ncbi:ParB/RepB/Spo0J family partition protein [Leptospira weilii]|uniref:ParB/RepB/Spo0J family partition protein n=1 Tax=Leptospira weilii TaxID=28184 RepID=UPI000774B871|nr:ParB/RepB/Spo0J family partition protein [Leptospira weilii]
MAKKREIFSLLSTATGSKMEPEEAEERLPSRANVFLQDLANSNGQNGELRKIKISLIDSKNNPRKTFIQESIEGLAKSIKAQGLIQPIVVKKAGKRFNLIAGERRKLAMTLNGEEFILALVHDVDYIEDEFIPEYKLTENLQREDLSDLESAFSLSEIKERKNYTVTELMNRFGKSESWVKQKLAHAKLADDLVSKNIIPSITLLNKVPTSLIMQLKPHIESNPKEISNWLIPKLQSTELPTRIEFQDFANNLKKTITKPTAIDETKKQLDKKYKITLLIQKIQKDKDLISVIKKRITQNQKLLDELQNKKKKT